MRVNQTIFLKLMIGAFALVIVGFIIRGLSTVAVGSETAMLVAAPVFILAVLFAVIAFILALLIKTGIVDDETREETTRTEH